ncbi:MAG TPA: hypothetical protein VGQ83_27850 [Polyangia bacterium]|jgi:hypothetical protein
MSAAGAPGATRAPAAARARHASRAAVAPLGVIAVCAVLPFVHYCEKTVSPAAYAAESLLQALWVAPRFLAAAGLAALTAVALGRGRAPARASALAALALLAACVASVGVEWWMIAARRIHSWGFVLWLAAASAGAPLLILDGLRGAGWPRWGRLLGAYGLLASPLCLVLVSLGPRGVRLGGYLYLAAVPALFALTLWALWPGAAGADPPGGDPAA